VCNAQLGCEFVSRAPECCAPAWVGGGCGRWRLQLHPDVLFRAPVYWKTREGRKIVSIILATVLEVFQDFQYHRIFVDSTQRHIVLEFSARIGSDHLKGVDLVTLTEDRTQIAELEVCARLPTANLAGVCMLSA
jgi:hypothetical protein